MEMWRAVTELAVAKQGPAIALILTGRKREVSLEIPVDRLKHKNSVETLLEKLEAVFAKETNDQCFGAYENFELVRRKGNDMEEYIQI